MLFEIDGTEAKILLFLRDSVCLSTIIHQGALQEDWGNNFREMHVGGEDQAKVFKVTQGFLCSLLLATEWFSTLQLRRGSTLQNFYPLVFENTTLL